VEKLEAPESSLESFFIVHVQMKVFADFGFPAQKLHFYVQAS
jgi:hypothetical protein